MARLLAKFSRKAQYTYRLYRLRVTENIDDITDFLHSSMHTNQITELHLWLCIARYRCIYVHMLLYMQPYGEIRLHDKLIIIIST